MGALGRGREQHRGSEPRVRHPNRDPTDSGRIAGAVLDCRAAAARLESATGRPRESARRLPHVSSTTQRPFGCSGDVDSVQEYVPGQHDGHQVAETQAGRDSRRQPLWVNRVSVRLASC